MFYLGSVKNNMKNNNMHKECMMRSDSDMIVENRDNRQTRDITSRGVGAS